MPREPLIHTSGQGPDLVMVHGWGMSDACWGDFAAHLATRFRLHRVTLPGHGGSRDVSWSLSGLLDRLLPELPPAAWLGWSLGGTLALAAALARPDRVPSVVMLAATPCFVARSHWPQGVPAGEFARFEAYCRDDAIGTQQRFRSRVADGGPDPDAVLRVLETGTTAGREAALAGLSVLADTDLSDRLDALTTPALWISGAGDRVVNPGAVREAAGRHAGGRLLALPQAGHAPHLDHPGVLAGQVADWLVRRAAT